MSDLEIRPQTASLTAGQTQQFAAFQDGNPVQDAQWSLQPKGAGTIESSGLYTAPRPIFRAQKVVVRAEKGWRVRVSRRGVGTALDQNPGDLSARLPCRHPRHSDLAMGESLSHVQARKGSGNPSRSDADAGAVATLHRQRPGHVERPGTFARRRRSVQSAVRGRLGSRQGPGRRETRRAQMSAAAEVFLSSKGGAFVATLAGNDHHRWQHRPDGGFDTTSSTGSSGPASSGSASSSSAGELAEPCARNPHTERPQQLDRPLQCRGLGGRSPHDGAGPRPDRGRPQPDRGSLDYREAGLSADRRLRR